MFCKEQLATIELHSDHFCYDTVFRFDALEGICHLSFRKLCYAHSKTTFERGTSLEYCHMTKIWKTKRKNLKVDFHCRVIFPCVRT